MNLATMTERMYRVFISAGATPNNESSALLRSNIVVSLFCEPVVVFVDNNVYDGICRTAQAGR